jgi:endo-1,4-beta-xylanase
MKRSMLVIFFWIAFSANTNSIMNTLKGNFLFRPYRDIKAYLTDDGPECEKSSLCERAQFKVGAAIDFQKLIDEKRYRNLVISEFNSITPEKSMKAAYIHPERNTYNFNETDFLMDFCREHNKRLHGHTLVWYKDVPRWMEKFKGDKSAWEELLKNHIQTIVGHCRGRVHSWDVVNEAFNNDGTLRQNIWLKNIGEDYIGKCFRYAAEADPAALLFYNDFDLESRPEKLDAVISYLNNLKEKGVKIDGIGMQMHISITFPYISEIDLAAIKIEENGYLLHYSEMDITMVRTGKLWMMNKHLLDLQKNRVREIVAGYMKLKSATRFGITTWGVSDADSWLVEKNRNDRPLLFDSRYKVKPAYCGFLDGLKEK